MGVAHAAQGRRVRGGSSAPLAHSGVGQESSGGKRGVRPAGSRDDGSRECAERRRPCASCRGSEGETHTHTHIYIYTYKRVMRARACWTVPHACSDRCVSPEVA